MRCSLLYIGVLSVGCLWLDAGLAASVKPTPSPTPSQKTRGTSHLLPSADPLTPEPTRDVAADQKAIEKSRWVRPSPYAKPDTSAAKTEDKVRVEATCTDSRGMSHGVGDAEYGACMQEMSRSREREKDALDPHKDTGVKPGVGAGVNFKIGK